MSAIIETVNENQETTKLDRSGLIWAIVSYSMWGFFPLYWKLLSSLPSLEVLAHRMIWSFVFYFLIYIFSAGLSWRGLLHQSKRDWLLLFIASSLITLNWGIYIYAVTTGHILEGSLAYFINPILNVAVGVLFFKEKFPLVLKLAVFFAFLAVTSKIILSPAFPWISIILALTFCAYGITKKMLSIPARTSSLLEGFIGFIPALFLAFYFHDAHDATSKSAWIWAYLVLGGLVTGLPLLIFAYAAQRIPYSVLGIIQFIAPSLQFLVGVLIYKENFGTNDLISFGLIWAAMSFYLIYQVTFRKTTTYT